MRIFFSGDNFFQGGDKTPPPRKVIKITGQMKIFPEKKGPISYDAVTEIFNIFNMSDGLWPPG